MPRYAMIALLLAGLMFSLVRASGVQPDFTALSPTFPKLTCCPCVPKSSAGDFDGVEAWDKSAPDPKASFLESRALLVVKLRAGQGQRQLQRQQFGLPKFLGKIISAVVAIVKKVASVVMAGLAVFAALAAKFGLAPRWSRDMSAKKYGDSAGDSKLQGQPVFDA